MKISLNWLKLYVELPDTLTPEKLAYDLTMSTVEVEGVEHLGSSLKKIVVGVIKELRAHPNADRLKIAVTDIGTDELKEVICGGSNLEVGMKVAVSLPGSFVKWHGEGELVEVKETKIRGSKSFGMICASSEIGLSNLFPSSDEKEIIDLSSLEARAGDNLSDLLFFDDYIFEIDNKSLSNRPDLWGHYGLARELSAIYSLPLKEIDLAEIAFDKSSKDISIDIADSRCSRYSAVLVEGVDNCESPLWLKSALSRVGQKPISLLVDLTNYVMFSVGQPTHVFDYSDINDSKIVVRAANKKEKLSLLDGSELEFENNNLLIADSSRPLALAGVMGGLASGAAADTKKVLFESANFEAIDIRRTASSLGIRSDSSMRFEKGLDVNQVLTAQKLLIKLLKEVQPSIKLISAVDINNAQEEEISINITKNFIESRIGQVLDEEFFVDKLSRLGFKVSSENSSYEVQVPTWRATGDVSIKQDLVEEVARMIGYDSLEPYPVSVVLEKPKGDSLFSRERAVKDYLAMSAKLQEIVTYPWVNEKYIHNSAEALALLDPPDPKQKTLKTTLIPNMLWAISENVKHTSHFGLFEISRVFIPSSRSEFSSSSENLPYQPKNLALSLVGKDSKEVFLELKGIVEGLFKVSNIVLEFVESSDTPWGSQVSLDLKVSSEVIGTIALFDSKRLSKLSIDRLSVAVFEMNFDKFLAAQVLESSYKAPSKYPTSEYELAILFEEKIKWGDVKSAVSASDKFIREVIFQDDYRGQQVPNGQKSLAFKMILSDENSTLESKQIDKIASKVLKNLKNDFGGVLRDA